jgi:purine-nucleoside phosphorylase
MMIEPSHLGSEAARIAAAVEMIRARVGPPLAPRVGIVLGSGLGAALSSMDVHAAIPYSEIPGFPPSTVAGHAGRLIVGRLSGVEIVVMQGRVHLYEGHAMADVVLPVRVLIALGARSLIITNAAGGVNPAFLAGDLMLIIDQLNLTGRSPLLGPNDAALGPRFPDMTEVYTASFRQAALEAAARIGLGLREGVYAGLLGPAYETPAEIRMLRTLGADAVGMSTVLEVIAARHMGARVLGISCISNQAAGITGEPLSHEEVQAVAKAAEGRLFGLVAEVLPKIAGA